MDRLFWDVIRTDRLNWIFSLLFEENINENVYFFFGKNNNNAIYFIYNHPIIKIWNIAYDNG